MPSASGPLGGRRLLAAVAVLGMAILAIGHRARAPSTPRAVPGQATEAQGDPRQRGKDYEDHALERLARLAKAEGSTLRAHPRILPPELSVAAHYHAMPAGWSGGLVPDPTPHPSAPTVWPTFLTGGFRIPDAIVRHLDGRQELIELKCLSPWLTFDGGSRWAGLMQAAFASQALAFIAWAADDPNRRVTYGFCGLPPRWAQALLIELGDRLGVRVQQSGAFLAEGFDPARRFLDKAASEALTASALGALARLAPEAVFGAVFDRLKD